MLCELIETTTADGLILHGALYRSDRSPPINLPLDAVLLLHGVGGNFYNSVLLRRLAESFLQCGLTAVCANTRGHDFVSLTRTPRGPQRLGAAYETVGSGYLDVAAWNDLLCARGATRIAVLGHSLGGVKVVHATVHHPHAATRCVVAISPPRLSYESFLAGPRQRLFEKTIARARAHVGEGKPESLIRVKYPLPLLITAAGYLEKYGPEENYNILRFAQRLPSPALFTFGQLEIESGSMAFADLPRLLADLPCGSHPLQILTVAEADHHYSGLEDELASRIIHWFSHNRLTSPGGRST